MYLQAPLSSAGIIGSHHHTYLKTGSTHHVETVCPTMYVLSILSSLCVHVYAHPGGTTRGSWVLLSHGSRYQTQVDRTVSKCPYLLNCPFAYFGALRTYLLHCCPGSSPIHSAPVSVSVVAGITGLHHATMSLLHCSPAAASFCMEGKQLVQAH